MKKILLIAGLSVLSYGDMFCTYAGADIEQYSRAYENAKDEYTNAVSNNDKNEAKEEIESSRGQLVDAVSSAFQSCENNLVGIMGELLEQKKLLLETLDSLKKENEALKQKNKELRSRGSK